MRRTFRKILYFMIATIAIMAVRQGYAQIVEFPNPDWPLDSVVRGSVHYYKVQGDRNYTSPSDFVWVTDGGRLFLDPDLTRIAGNGISDTVKGNMRNITEMWVVWDKFLQPLDTGYIYVYEISADGCQRAVTDAGKYQGMRIKVSAPPKARFLLDETIACTNIDSAQIIIEIEGMPPYDLKYSKNGVITDWHITQNDLADLDGDGEVDNVGFWLTGYTNNMLDQVIEYELIEVSSGGVNGKILFNYPNHTALIHVQPHEPDIFVDWREVTTGTPNIYNYTLAYRGDNPKEWYWELRDENTNLIDAYSSTADPNWGIVFNSEPGKYYLRSYYLDSYGCYSPDDTLNLELFGQPTIAFSDSTPDIRNCSATSMNPDEKFEFAVEYYGARTYSFTYTVYDYEGKVVDSGTLEYLESRTNIITINNNFINDALPEVDRPWKVVLTSADNEEPNIEVKIIDSDIIGGKDERVIMIHPKPFIHEDIDFAN